MSLTFPKTLLGEEGVGIIKQYSDPRFVFTALTEIEDIFVQLLTRKFDDFVATEDMPERPAIVPAYNPGDKYVDVIVVEAQLNSLMSQGLGYNRFEVAVYPEPENDPENIEVYLGVSGDASYTVELYVRGTHRFRAAYCADWVLAALSDPMLRKTFLQGLHIPANSIRASGRLQEVKGPSDVDKLWAITFTIPNLILPWARFYRMDGPSILETEIGLTVDNTL